MLFESVWLKLNELFMARVSITISLSSLLLKCEYVPIVFAKIVAQAELQLNVYSLHCYHTN